MGGTGREEGRSAARLFPEDHMPPRRKSTATGSHTRISKAVRAHRNRATISRKRATAKRWRRDVRPRLLRAAAAATESLPWTSRLLELLLEELYVGDRLEDLLGSCVQKLQKRRYPQAIAVALVLRHSWRPDDLDCILTRLGLPLGRHSEVNRHRQRA